jgi:hypothetical protein
MFCSQDLHNGARQIAGHDWSKSMHSANGLCCAVLCCAGSDLSKWTIKRWWFNGQFYATINDLISSWNADNKGVRSSFKLLKPGGDACQHGNRALQHVHGPPAPGCLHASCVLRHLKTPLQSGVSLGWRIE